MARTMLMVSKLTYIFWTHVVYRTVHIQNWVIIRNKNDKNPNELWKGSTENNLYIKVTQDNILLIEVYFDDIIFGSINDRLSQKIAKDMQNEFEISLLGELSFFLGLQIRQSNQVYQRNAKEVLNGRLQTSYHSHANQFLSWEKMMIRSLQIRGNIGQWLEAYYMWQHLD